MHPCALIKKFDILPLLNGRILVALEITETRSVILIEVDACEPRTTTLAVTATNGAPSCFSRGKQHTAIGGRAVEFSPYSM